MEPSKYNEVKNQMESLLHKTVYSNEITEPSIAYTYSRTNTLCGTIYRLYVNNTDKLLAKYLYMHECGHILYGHAKNMDLRQDRFLRSKIQSAFSKVSSMFNNYTKDLETFTEILFNVVMDFEVNSSLFTKEEFDFMNQRVASLLNQPMAKGLWPQDYGYSLGKTWNEYLNLILMDPKTFMQQLRTSINHKLAVNNKGHLSQEEYEQHLKDVQQGRFSNEEMEELHNLSKDHNHSTFDIPNGLMEGRSTTSNNPCKIDFVSYKDNSELLNKILKELRIKLNSNNKRDLLYNSNRRKHNSNVIIPKSINTEYITTTKKMYLLFDVSGSVNAKMIYDFIQTFKHIKKQFRKVQIVTWNTNLVKEWTIDEPIKNFYGGGTNLAPGIQYIARQNKLKKNDVLFVISDFQDDLKAWNKSLKSINCKKYAINWNSYCKADNPGFEKIFLAG